MEISRRTGVPPKGDRKGWYYLCVRQGGIGVVERRLGKRFETYRYHGMREETEGLRTTEKPMYILSKTLFVHGLLDEITEYIRVWCPSIRLETDCATGLPAYVSEEEMKDFITVAESKRPIRLLLNSEAFYWLGNNRVRVVSGYLQGMEGYIIRLNKDRKLVMRMGDKMVAVRLNSDEIWRPVDDYAGLIGEGIPEGGAPAVALAAFQTLRDGVRRPDTLPNLITMSKELRKVVAYVRLLLSLELPEEATRVASRTVAVIGGHMSSFAATIASTDLSRYYDKEMRKIVRDLLAGFKERVRPDGKLLYAPEVEQLSDRIRISPYLRGCFQTPSRQ